MFRINGEGRTVSMEGLSSHSRLDCVIKNAIKIEDTVLIRLLKRECRNIDGSDYLREAAVQGSINCVKELSYWNIQNPKSALKAAESLGHAAIVEYLKSTFGDLQGLDSPLNSSSRSVTNYGSILQVGSYGSPGEVEHHGTTKKANWLCKVLSNFGMGTCTGGTIGLVDVVFCPYIHLVTLPSSIYCSFCMIQTCIFGGWVVSLIALCRYPQEAEDVAMMCENVECLSCCYKEVEQTQLSRDFFV